MFFSLSISLCPCLSVCVCVYVRVSFFLPLSLSKPLATLCRLDGVVQAAAEADDPNRVLMAYGYGGSVPTAAKRRLQQSVALARKLLEMQKLLVKKEVITQQHHNILHANQDERLF